MNSFLQEQDYTGVNGVPEGLAVPEIPPFQMTEAMGLPQTRADDYGQMLQNQIIDLNPRLDKARQKRAEHKSALIDAIQRRAKLAPVLIQQQQISAEEAKIAGMTALIAKALGVRDQFINQGLQQYVGTRNQQLAQQSQFTQQQANLDYESQLNQLNAEAQIAQMGVTEADQELQAGYKQLAEAEQNYNDYVTEQDKQAHQLALEQAKQAGRLTLANVNGAWRQTLQNEKFAKIASEMDIERNQIANAIRAANPSMDEAEVAATASAYVLAKYEKELAAIESTKAGTALKNEQIQTEIQTRPGKVDYWNNRTQIEFRKLDQADQRIAISAMKKVDEGSQASPTEIKALEKVAKFYQDEITKLEEQRRQLLIDLGNAGDDEEVRDSVNKELAKVRKDIADLKKSHKSAVEDVNVAKTPTNGNAPFDPTSLPSLKGKIGK